MRYQYKLSSASDGTETNSFWFNHKFMGWVTLPKDEMKDFIKIIKAKTRN